MNNEDKWKREAMRKNPLLLGLPLEQIQFCRVCKEYFNIKNNKRCKNNKYKHETLNEDYYV